MHRTCAAGSPTGVSHRVTRVDQTRAPEHPSSEDLRPCLFFSFEIDPHQVLGVGPQATLEEIRDAYRRRPRDIILMPAVKTGRFASWSSRTRCSARSAWPAPPEPSPSRAAHPVSAHGRGPNAARNRSTPGSSTAKSTRSRMVAVELLCVRYLWDDADYLWLTQRRPTRSDS